MEALAAALIFGGFWFWTIVFGTFFCIMAFNEYDRYFSSAGVLILVVLLFQWVGTISILAHPWHTLGFIATYLVLGGPWSLVKWFSFLRQEADKFAELKLNYIKKVNNIIQHHIDNPEEQEPNFAVRANQDIPKDAKLLELSEKTKIPDIHTSYFKSSLNNKGYKHWDSPDYRPNASEFKGKLMSWVIWWPTSLFWTILDDPIRRFAQAVYKHLQNTYERMSKKVYSRFEA